MNTFTLETSSDFHVDSSNSFTAGVHSDDTDLLIGHVTIDFATDQHIIKLDFVEHVPHALQARFLLAASDMLDSYFDDNVKEPTVSMTLEL